MAAIFNLVRQKHPGASLVLIGSDSFDIATQSKSTWELIQKEFKDNDFEKVSIIRMIKTGNTKIVLLESCNEDLTGELSFEERVYEEKVEITEDELKFNGNTILRAPLVYGKEWTKTHKFNNGKEILSKFKIIALSPSIVTVEINSKNKYIERFTFETGKGLIKFEDNSFFGDKISERYVLISTFIKPIDEALWYNPPYMFDK